MSAEELDMDWEGVEYRVEESDGIDEFLGVHVEEVMQENPMLHVDSSKHDVLVSDYVNEIHVPPMKLEFVSWQDIVKWTERIGGGFGTEGSSMMTIFAVLMAVVAIVWTYWFMSQSELRRNRSRRKHWFPSLGADQDRDFSNILSTVEYLQERTLAAMKGYNMERTNVQTRAGHDGPSLSQLLEASNFTALIASILEISKEFAILLKHIDSKLPLIIDTRASRLRDFRRQVLGKIEWNIGLLNGVLCVCTRCRYCRKRVLIMQMAECREKLERAQTCGAAMLANHPEGAFEEQGSALAVPSPASCTSTGILDMRDAVALCSALGETVSAMTMEQTSLDFAALAPQVEFSVDLGAEEERRVQALSGEAEHVMRLAAVIDSPDWSLAFLHEHSCGGLLKEVTELLHQCESAADEAMIENIRRRLEASSINSPAAIGTPGRPTAATTPMPSPASPPTRDTGEFFAPPPAIPIPATPSTPITPPEVFVGAASGLVEGHRNRHFEYISGLRFAHSRLIADLEKSEGQWRADKLELEGSKARMDKCFRIIEEKLKRLEESLSEDKSNQRSWDGVVSYTSIILCFFLVTAIQLYNNVVSQGRSAYLTKIWVLMDQICCDRTAAASFSSTTANAGAEPGFIRALHNASDWLSAFANTENTHTQQAQSMFKYLSWDRVIEFGKSLGSLRAEMTSRTVSQVLFMAFGSLGSVYSISSSRGAELKRVLDIVCCLCSLVITPAISILVLRYFRWYWLSLVACFYFAYYMAIEYPAILSLMKTFYESLGVIIAVQVFVQLLVYWFDDRTAWNIGIWVPNIPRLFSFRSTRAVLFVNPSERSGSNTLTGRTRARRLASSTLLELSQPERAQLIVTESGAFIRTDAAVTKHNWRLEIFDARFWVLWVLLPLVLLYIAALLACVPTVYSRGIALGMAPDDWSHRHTCAQHNATLIAKALYALIMTPLYEVIMARLKTVL